MLAFLPLGMQAWKTKRWSGRWKKNNRGRGKKREKGTAVLAPSGFETCATCACHSTAAPFIYCMYMLVIADRPPEGLFYTNIQKQMAHHTCVKASKHSDCCGREEKKIFSKSHSKPGRNGSPKWKIQIKMTKRRCKMNSAICTFEILLYNKLHKPRLKF